MNPFDTNVANLDFSNNYLRTNYYIPLKAVNCTQNTQPFGSGCGFWVSEGTYPKPIPKTHTQILKKSHTHTQNPYPYPKPIHKYSKNPIPTPKNKSHKILI